MKTKSLFLLLALWGVGASYLTLLAQTPTQQLVSPTGADTWPATDALGRELPTQTRQGQIRPDRFVGIFYFVWHGAHGFDHHSKGRPDGDIIAKTPADTLSPYDISKILQANPQKPQYGPVGAWHHWAEPYFGYYLPTDEWVIRKHGQMLADAGVDVIVFDVTNAFIYEKQVSKVAQTFQAMRREGQHTPGIAFMANGSPKRQVQRLFDTFYKKGLFQDLWFYWKGKPLLLTPAQGHSDETRAFFTSRHAWAWRNHWDNWFGDGKDKWPWVDHTPQAYGWHESPDKPEQISVSIAQHPIYFGVGRSFHNGRQPALRRPGEGLYFAEQWQRAIAVDPEFVFVTGWNEWMTMRFKSPDDAMFLGKPLEFAGKPVKKGDDYFVDLYDTEYSRDAEPVKGHFQDNYYYQLVDNIRRFKGARALPVYRESHRIRVDGRFADWQQVAARFADDAGDTFHRRHPGYGRIKEYINTTGRNDLVETKVTSDKNYVYFYVRAATPLTAWNSGNWMRLFIRVGDSPQPAWEGFHFLVNRQPKSSRQTILQKSLGAGQWGPPVPLRYRSQGNELEIRIPKKALGLTGKAFTLDFKWADNTPLDGDPMHWLDKGDAAPNARFRYRYIKQ